MTKKHFAIILCLILVLTLFAACNKDNQKDPESTDAITPLIEKPVSTSEPKESKWEKVSLNGDGTVLDTLVTDKIIAYASNFVSVSTDGKSFNKVLDRDGSPFSYLYADGPKYILTTSDSRWYLWLSDDGLTYEQLNDNLGYYNGIYGITYANGQYVATTQSGELRVSEDGLQWTSHTVGQMPLFLESMLYKTVYANGSYYGMMGDGLAISSNLDEWTVVKPDLPYGCTMENLLVNGDTVIMTSWNPNSLYILNNGKLNQVEGITSYIADIKYSGNYYAMQSNGTVLISSNGTEWTEKFTSPEESGVRFYSMEVFKGSIYLFSEFGDVYNRPLD